jgi:Tfp pilus assembly protein PilF
MSRPTTVAIVVVMALAALAALLWPREAPPSRPPATTTPAPPTPAAGPTREADDLLTRIEAQTAAAEQSGSWVEWDVVASLWMDRADAGGGLDDLGRASQALDRAFAVADPGVGPHLRAAVLAFRLHRLDDCETLLESVERYAIVSADDRDAIDSLRADIAFFRGEYAAARTAYEATVARDPHPTALVALARLEWSTGHADRAAALLERAEGADTHQRLTRYLALAQTSFARERGDLQAAERAIVSALRARRGDEDAALLLAEILVDRGELERAERVLERLPDSARYHELGARIARARGDTITQEEHAAAAMRDLDASYGAFPEAVAGHALSCVLRFGPAGRAVEIAELNARARPFGEARARLALAYLRAGRAEDARREIEAVLATEWSTGESHAIASEVFEALHDERAAHERELAETLSPGVTARVTDLAPDAPLAP